MTIRYTLPIEIKKIDAIIVGKAAPGHILYKENEKMYDLSNAYDFIAKKDTEIYFPFFKGIIYDLCNKISNTYSLEDKLKGKIPEGEEDGNFVMVKVREKEFLWFCHLSEISPKLKEGVSLKQGDYIGKVGSTGVSLEPHLHIHLQRFNSSNPKQGDSYITLKILWKGIPDIDNGVILMKDIDKLIKEYPNIKLALYICKEEGYPILKKEGKSFVEIDIANFL